MTQEGIGADCDAELKEIDAMDQALHTPNDFDLMNMNNDDSEEIFGGMDIDGNDIVADRVAVAQISTRNSSDQAVDAYFDTTFPQYWTSDQKQCVDNARIFGQ